MKSPLRPICHRFFYIFSIHSVSLLLPILSPIRFFLFAIHQRLWYPELNKFYLLKIVVLKIDHFLENFLPTFRKNKSFFVYSIVGIFLSAIHILKFVSVFEIRIKLPFDFNLACRKRNELW